MKKLICLLLALLMITSVSLVACKDKDKEGEDTGDDLLFPGAVSDYVGITSTTDDASTSYVFTDVNETVYVKNCLKVNLRNSPSAATSDNIVGTLTFGDERTYKRVKYNEVWSGLEINGEVLYVNSDFLTTKADFVVFDAADKTVYVNNEVSDSGLNVYNFTDNKAKDCKWGVVKNGAELHVTGISKDTQWYRVEFTYTENGKTFTETNLYVINSKYLSETKPAAQ